MAATMKHLIGSLVALALVTLPAQSANTPGIVISDGTHTVATATHLTVTGATVGGTSPNATLTVTPGGSGTVNSGLAGQVGSYLTTGAAISGAYPSSPGFINPLNYNVSGLNTTGVGACTASSPTFTSFNGNPNGLAVGMDIAVAGAGAAAATLITTVSALPSSTTVTLGTNCLTTVALAVGTGTISGGSHSLSTGSAVAGMSNGAVVYVANAGAALPSTIAGPFNAPIVSGGGTATLTLGGAAATTTSSGAFIFSYGAPIYAIGTMGATSTTLTFTHTASIAGWAVNQGIDVAGAGTAGADLITTVAAVGTTTLTLNAPSVGAVTNAKVNHDDTAALNAALGTGLNVEPGAGQFNITSALNIANPQWLKCAGAGVGQVYFGSTQTTPNFSGTVIINRGTTNNVLSVTQANAHVSDCGITQAPDVVPTAGYGLVVGTGSSTEIVTGIIEKNTVLNTFGLFEVNQGVEAWSFNRNTFMGGQFTVTMATDNNPLPAGDNRITDNFFGQGFSVPGEACLTLTNTDTNFWIGNKFVVCDPAVTSASTNVSNQNFVGNSFENNGSLGAIAISNGTNFMFTGDQFGVDGGFGIYKITGGSGIISGNIGTNNVTGAFCSITGGTWVHLSGSNAPTC